MSLSISQYAVVASAGLVSWIVVDLLSNMFLKKSKKGTQLRLKFLGTRWLKWKPAIAGSFIQFGIAFVASYLLQDYFTNLFTQNAVYLFPILFSVCGFIYAYIYGLSPYKKSLERFALSLILIAVAILLFLGIWYFTKYPFKF